MEWWEGVLGAAFGVTLSSVGYVVKGAVDRRNGERRTTFDERLDSIRKHEQLLLSVQQQLSMCLEQIHWEDLTYAFVDFRSTVESWEDHVRLAPAVFDARTADNIEDLLAAMRDVIDGAEWEDDEWVIRFASDDKLDKLGQCFRVVEARFRLLRAGGPGLWERFRSIWPPPSNRS